MDNEKRIKKCKICGVKGVHYPNYGEDEYTSTRPDLLMILKKYKKDKFFYICRNCIIGVLQSLEAESRSIRTMYEKKKVIK